jgi:hypothetical protein
MIAAVQGARSSPAPGCGTVDKAVAVLRGEGLVKTVMGLGIFPVLPDELPKT